jgi:GntR family transcriptional repressor for pyruvate dehydrogenase complex
LARAEGLNGGPLSRFYAFAFRGSLSRLRQANELRCAVEPGFAKLAALRQESVGIRNLHVSFEKMRESTGDPDEFSNADVLFHQAVAQATGNKMIVVQMEGLESIHREVSRVFTKRRQFAESEWVETLERHKRILEAIKSGDVDGAGLAMDAHFEKAEKAAFEVAEEAGEWWKH